METAWPSGAPIGPPPPREPVEVRPTDRVVGRRVAWASPSGLLRDYWIMRGPVQGRELGHTFSIGGDTSDPRVHEWYVLIIRDEAWQRWIAEGEHPDVTDGGWTPIWTVWLD